VSTEVLIELDTGPIAPAAPRNPPVHRYRTIGLVLAVLLAFTTAGAVPELAPVWRRDGIAPVGPDALFAMAGDRLYAASVTGSVRTVSAWSTRPFRALWTADLPAGDGDRLELLPVPGRLLVRVVRSDLGPSTTALDDRTGVRAWLAPNDVLPLPGGHTGLVQEQTFRDGDEYDEDSGAAGPLWFSENGTAYRRPPDHTVLHGIDLTDGSERWSQRWRGSIFAAPATMHPATVVVVSAESDSNMVTQRLALLDADTGGVHRQRLLDGQAFDGSGLPESGINAQAVDGLLVLERSASNAITRTAFGLNDLEERWRLPYRDISGMSRFCAGVPCVETPYGLSVLDPVTGAVRWKTVGSSELTARGGHALELNVSGPVPVPRRTVDAATGAPRVDLSAWPTSVVGAPDAPLVLAAPDDRGGTAFGVLPRGGRAVRPLGRSSAPLSDCRVDTRLVACRAAAGVEVFEFRP
jgi:hypothetical protein